MLLLAALSAWATPLPALALDDAKPTKPLNLLSFARTTRAPATQKPRAVAAAPAIDKALKATAFAADETAPLVTGAVPAPEAAPRPVKTAAAASPAKPAAPPASSPENDVAQFCSSVADPAVDARLAWQMRELEKAEAQLRERIAEVEAKRAEYEKWMALRDEFLKKAEASVVEVYSRMRPDAAASMIAGMADEPAAAVLAKLSPRNSSAIFNEMDTARAAHLADLLGGMRRVDDGKTDK